MVNKKGKVAKPNQLVKSIGRLNKITVFSALANRAKNWKMLEQNPELLAKVTKVYEHAEGLEAGRMDLLSMVQELVATHYTPPKKATSGELKFEPGRQVWIKDKYVGTYKEGGYSEAVLNNLHVFSVVKGRVFLSVGQPNLNGQSNTPPVAVPKIHVTGANPQATA